MEAQHLARVIADAETALVRLVPSLREYGGLVRDDIAPRPSAALRARVARATEQLRELAETLPEA